MKILVTGGAGFIGSHLTRALLAKGHAVAVLDNLHTGLRENVPLGAAFAEMDVRDERLGAWLSAEKFDAVVHLAGQTMVNVSVDEPYYDADVNVLGTVNLLEGCRKSGVRRVVFASTAAVYGDVGQLPVLESQPVGPLSFYGLSKHTVERYLALYQALYGLEYVALRFANVYGERQGDGGEGGVISIFAKRVARGEAIVVHGDGGQTRDFVYAGDVAEGICCALETKAVNCVYHLSTQTEVSVNALVALLRELAGGEIEVSHGPARPGDIYRSMLSNARAAEGLGWRPVVPLEEGLARTFAYFAKTREARG